MYLKGGLNEDNINNEGVEIIKEITKENSWRKFSGAGKNIKSTVGRLTKWQVDRNALDAYL